VRVVFAGSGAFAIPALETLASSSSRQPLALVVSRPDRPQGRGRRMEPTPVRKRALELGLSVDAPESANDPAYLDRLEALGADLCIVADYGELLGKRFRSLWRIGAFNLHGSILPAYRGAAPVAHAILHGETEAGVTLFRIVKELDAGPIVDVERTAIGPLESAGELEARLASLSGALLARNLEAFASGSFRETPQDSARATYAPKLEKSAGLIDWSLGARTVANLSRAMNPWPGAHSFLIASGRPPERTVFPRLAPAPGTGAEGAPPGAVAEVRKDGFRIACGEGAVEVLEVQREGKAAMKAPEYLRGRPLRPGDRFSTAPEATP
jgi:methionyl-tRNA formyltransferase